MSDIEAVTEEPAQNLGERASRAAAWTFIGFGIGQLVRLVGNIILARLLFPEAFGLMLIAGVLVQGLLLFSDLGIGPSIVQNKAGDDREFLDTAWTMQSIRGVVLTLASLLAAWPFAQFYNDDRLFLIVVVIGCSAFFQGLGSTKIFTVGRHLNPKRLIAIEIVSQLIGVASMITSALVSPTYWALVAGALMTPLSKMVLSHIVLEGPINRFRWHTPSVRSLFHFGKWIFLSTALTFFAGQSDRLIFAKLIPLDMLGVYSFAAMITLMPLTLFGHIEKRVVFPVYSEVARKERELAPVFTRARAGYLTAGGVICAGLFAAGPSLIEVLYDERYHQAGWMLRYLTIGTWLTLVQTTYGAAHLATARVQWVAASSMCKVIGIIAFVSFGYEVAGFEGAVLGYALSEFLRYAVLAFGGRMMKLPGLGQDVFLTLVIVVTAWLGVMGGNVIPDAGAVMRTATIGTIVGLLWTPLIYTHLGKAVALVRKS